MKLTPNWLPAFLCLCLLTPLLGSEDQAPMSADEILSKTIERAKEVAERNPEGRMHYDYLSVSHELNDQDEVKKEETKLYRNVPVEGIPFQRLVEKDGEPLEGGDLKDEREREKEFRRKVAQGKDPRDENENRMEFDEELTGRYYFALDGQESLDGHDCWVLSFRPREGDLPNKRRIDAALNKSIGKLWVAKSNYEIVRARFELTDPVRLWWGLIGKIGQLEGRVDRRPVKDGLWMPRRFDLYLKGRIFFSGLHRRQQVEWSNFEYAESERGASAEDAAPAGSAESSSSR